MQPTNRWKTQQTTKQIKVALLEVGKMDSELKSERYSRCVKWACCESPTWFGQQWFIHGNRQLDLPVLLILGKKIHSFKFRSCQSLEVTKETKNEIEKERSAVFNVCMLISLKAAWCQWRRMEAITIICWPDLQGSLSFMYLGECACAVLCVLHTAPDKSPPGPPCFLPFHPCHSPQRAASTHPQPCCPPWFSLQIIHQTDNYNRSSDR